MSNDLQTVPAGTHRSVFVIAAEARIDALVDILIGSQFELQEMHYLRARMLQLASAFTTQIEEANKFYDEQARLAGQEVPERGSVDLQDGQMRTLSVMFDEEGCVIGAEDVTPEPDVPSPEGMRPLTEVEMKRARRLSTLFNEYCDRYEPHLTRAQLAKELDWTPSTVTFYLNGRMALGMEAATAFADRLNFDPAEVHEGFKPRISGEH